MTQKQIALVDDEEDLRDLVSAFLRQKGFAVLPFTNASDLLTEIELRGKSFDVIISDLMLPNITGIELVRTLKERQVETPIIIITANRGSEKAIEAIEAGAYDFVIKPVHFSQLLVSVERALHFNRIKSENSFLRLATAVEKGTGLDGIIGRSKGLLHAIDLAKRVAGSTANVFISGETGTGKEVIARCIHNFGPRKTLPFLAINCSAIPENLLESELFGHAKGSFTGATEKKVGLFEDAGEGSIFLDEIGDLGFDLQSKLLRVLQEKKIRRIGENQLRPIRARIISATHKDLRKEIRDNRFREDLFFRLNVIPIHLPPLRERLEDIIPLAEFFLRKYALLNKANILRFQKTALELLLKNPWRGNVRELENTIERAVVLAQGEWIQDSDLNIDLPSSECLETNVIPTIKELPSFSPPHKGLVSLDDAINAYIKYALEKNLGAKDKTAKDLKIDRKTLYRRLNEIKRLESDSHSPINFEQNIN